MQVNDFRGRFFAKRDFGLSERQYRRTRGIGAMGFLGEC